MRPAFVLTGMYLGKIAIGRSVILNLYLFIWFLFSWSIIKIGWKLQALDHFVIRTALLEAMVLKGVCSSFLICLNKGK